MTEPASPHEPDAPLDPTDTADLPAVEIDVSEKPDAANEPVVGERLGSTVRPDRAVQWYADLRPYLADDEQVVAMVKAAPLHSRANLTLVTNQRVLLVLAKRMGCLLVSGRPLSSVALVVQRRWTVELHGGDGGVQRLRVGAWRGVGKEVAFLHAAVRRQLRVTGGVWTGEAATWKTSGAPLNLAEAEVQAAEHMRHLGFLNPRVYGPGREDGIDVYDTEGAAQVRFHAAPIGPGEVRGFVTAAAAYRERLFYAITYAPATVEIANTSGVALFRFEPMGGISSVNGHAVSLSPPPVGQRRWYQLRSFDERRRRAQRWSQELNEYVAGAKLSNFEFRAAKQRARREEAKKLVDEAAAKLVDIDNATYRKWRQQRMLFDAERLLRRAGRQLPLTLR